MTEIDGPKHANSVNLNLTLPMDSVQSYNKEHYGIHDNTDDEHSKVWFDSACIDRYHLNCTWQYSNVVPIGIVKKCKLGSRNLCVLGLLSWPFLTQFPRDRFHIKGQGFGNKMYISELSIDDLYLFTVGF